MKPNGGTLGCQVLGFETVGNDFFSLLRDVVVDLVSLPNHLRETTLVGEGEKIHSPTPTIRFVENVGENIVLCDLSSTQTLTFNEQ